MERFNRILLEEWAYARAYTSETECQGCYEDFIDYYNRRRPHTALKGATQQPCHQPPGLVHLICSCSLSRGQG
ncbi:integrase core domain-containing protein [Pseudarthrobacter sp. ATCC 49987]|uniref:integrase core domain-containing protein n=1 Tax=Pseudarthrobacter sp. ATCC 49987 TaxID=2698204 RepID=UPI001922FD2D